MNEHKKRAKSMCRAIRTSWRSLQTHLQYAVEPDQRESDADEVFHANAIVEYANSILICAKELRHLNLERKKNGETTKPEEKSIPEPDSGCAGSSETGTSRVNRGAGEVPSVREGD